jgi:formylglycine-generating enzyme required for sulfatase activity
MRFLVVFFVSVVVALASVARPGLVQGKEASPNAAEGSALIIGEGAYVVGIAPSNLALNNAQSLARELAQLGFTVSFETNLRQGVLRRAIEAFTASIKPGAAALFFFSGYGIEAKGSTYLIPVDANIWTEEDVRAQGIAVESILSAMDKAGAKVKIVILDASRRNPFERRFRSLSTGLGSIEIPPQTLLLSAAEPRKVVSSAGRDGDVFLSELLKEMRAPDQSVQDVFNRTRLSVSRATNNRQTPWMLSTLAAPLLLRSSAGGPSASEQAQGAQSDAVAERIRVFPDAKPGTVFRDCANCPDLVIAPAGQFEMGSDDFDTERPAHSVVIAKPFAIGRSEVTFAQWDACVADGGCAGWRPDDRSERRNDAPVSEVSWSDAHRFIGWLSRKSGRAYRLPSEAEWEYAARGGATTRFWWGDEVGAGHANCRGCGGPGQPTPVGSYPANGFGLVDTAGNVAEWVEDCWTDSYIGAPRDGAVAQNGPCKQRVVRGGSFDAGPRYVRSASRFLYDAELRYYTNGFRVARDLP